jgi:uncharacterized BrkB/YihY/UPF0761 family membrane protein
VSDVFFIVCLFGGFYGFLYPAVVGLVFGACLLSSRAFRPRPAQGLPLLVPGALYYFLECLVARRQDWNMPYAVLALSLFVALTVIMSRGIGRPGWLKVGAALGAIVAFALWRLVPIQKWDRLF